MGIINFHIFDSSGNCLYSLNNPEKTDQQQILYGFLYSLKSFTSRMTPYLYKDNNFFLYSTSHYHLIFNEFPTSIKFVLILPVEMRNDSDFYRELLWQAYRQIYVQYVVKNPTIGPTHTANQTAGTASVDCELFRNQLNQFFIQNNLI